MKFYQILFFKNNFKTYSQNILLNTLYTYFVSCIFTSCLFSAPVHKTEKRIVDCTRIAVIVSVYVCPSVRSGTYFKHAHMSKLHEIFYTCRLGPWFGHPLTTTLWTSGFVDDVMFSHNGLLGVWYQQCTRERLAGKNSRCVLVVRNNNKWSSNLT